MNGDVSVPIKYKIEFVFNRPVAYISLEEHQEEEEEEWNVPSYLVFVVNNESGKVKLKAI